MVFDGRLGYEEETEEEREEENISRESSELDSVTDDEDHDRRNYDNCALRDSNRKRRISENTDSEEDLIWKD